MSLSGIRRTPGFIGRGFRLKAGRFLVPGLHPRRPQMPSRPLPLSVHDARSCFLDAPSTIVSLLPREAFGHVPQLHDESLPMSVPMTITPAGNLTTETPVGCPRFRRTSLGGSPSASVSWARLQARIRWLHVWPRPPLLDVSEIKLVFSIPPHRPTPQLRAELECGADRPAAGGPL